MFFSESAAWVMIFQLLFERIFQVTAHCSSILAQAAHLYKSVQDRRVNLSEWVWSSLAFVNQRWWGLNTIPFGSSRSCDAEQAWNHLCDSSVQIPFSKNRLFLSKQHNQQTRYLLYYIPTIPFSLSSPFFPLKQPSIFPIYQADEDAAHLAGRFQSAGSTSGTTSPSQHQCVRMLKKFSFHVMLKIGFYWYL